MDPNSVVDYITKTGGDASSEGRASLYEKTGLGKATDYLALGANNAEANTALLNKLRGTGPSVLMNTSTKSRTNYNQNTSDLSAALAKLSGAPTAANPNPDGNEETTTTTTDTTTTDPILQGFQTLQTNADAATKSLIATTQAAYQNQMNSVNKQYDSYKKGLQLLGIQYNEAQSTPDLLAGHIQQAANEQMEKIHSLVAEESKALMDANNAKAANDFKTLAAKMDYVKSIQTQKADAIKELYDRISGQSKIAAIEAHDIYDTMQSLNPEDQETFIQAVAQKYNLPLNSLVTALADEKATREELAVDLKNKKRIAGGGSTGGGGKVTIPSASSEIDSHLTPISEGGILGEDGYMSPYKWLELRDSWVKNKLAKATFDTLYKRYLNPLSYEMAGFAKPKGSSRTLVR